MAERMGFEPMVRSRESLVFKTSSINHSDTSPQWLPPNASIILAWKTGLVKPGLEKISIFFVGPFAAPPLPYSPYRHNQTKPDPAGSQLA